MSALQSFRQTPNPTNTKGTPMRRLAYYLAAAFVTAGVLAVTASPAHANIPVTCGSASDVGWYVNDDEGPLAPIWLADGLEFHGPGLVHHAVASPLALADLKPGTFTDEGLSGAKPLLKYETGSPYSTVNQAASGVDEFWSSKIPVGDVGGQDHPVSAADLSALAPYTQTTAVVTFGIGYAHDAGNADTITSLTFAGNVYSFTPCPNRPPAPPAVGGVTPTHAPTAAPTRGGSTPAGRPAQAGGVPAGHSGVTPSSTPSAVSPAPSESYDPLGIATATTDPGFSLDPVVPANDGAVGKSGESHLSDALIMGGLSLVLVGLLALWFVVRRRQSAQSVGLPPATPYTPGVARDLSATTEITAIDEPGGRHGERP